MEKKALMWLAILAVVLLIIGILLYSPQEEVKSGDAKVTFNVVPSTQDETSGQVTFNVVEGETAEGEAVE